MASFASYRQDQHTFSNNALLYIALVLSRLVALGKTGSGKTQFLRAISGSSEFCPSAGSDSSTQVVSKVAYQGYTLINTTGLGDSGGSQIDTQNLVKIAIACGEIGTVNALKRACTGHQLKRESTRRNLQRGRLPVFADV
ncbi:hypothetical protein TrLO_g11122 [Triparma laevis f. longispina]|uniref:G domain-containing protein n=1 Tax=Triparma laevis f. longispina TaxID=1714387 RepID=A0A9W7F3D7_9STRA|nr:hypothetical protein TrLO_g11122 [Triparma laevis f. longispina]